ncbi:hypothetical protein RN001_001381 [Aquatica leii]|uniref:Uncharacterized protein n=1 Tax=Aquatica leii TaxID=1421715 RepID=A0AAN7QAC4_9COLE|nr:hypothetical protein RN001_001381 [Aquatica leii]
MDIMQLFDQINDIIECLKTDDNYKCELKNYEIICSNGVNAVRFVPKDPTDVFQLYLGLVTLENLRDMKNCIIIKLQSLICVDDIVDSFTTDVVEAVDRKGLNSATRSDMCEVLSNKYIDNVDGTAVLSTIKELVQSNFEDLRNEVFKSAVSDWFRGARLRLKRHLKKNVT